MLNKTKSSRSALVELLRHSTNIMVVNPEGAVMLQYVFRLCPHTTKLVPKRDLHPLHIQ